MYGGAGAMMGRSQSDFTCRNKCQRRLPETLPASKAAASGLTRPREEHKQGHLAGTDPPPLRRVIVAFNGPCYCAADCGCVRAATAHCFVAPAGWFLLRRLHFASLLGRRLQVLLLPGVNIVFFFCCPFSTKIKQKNKNNRVAPTPGNVFQDQLLESLCAVRDRRTFTLENNIALQCKTYVINR